MLKLLLFSIAALLMSNFIHGQDKAGKSDTSNHTSFYTCSMHPDVVKDQPGKCPKCGMELKLTSKEKMKAAQAKIYVCPTHLEVTSHNAGKCPKCGKKMNLSAKEQMKAETGKVYTCPMHPETALNKDGVCPKCGKTLVEKQ